MIKKLKEKKGFTLVELIVVLVILAILAALLIPALTGYIDKAKNKSIVAETRQVVMAAQTLADEKYAKKDANYSADITFGENGDVSLKEVAELAEVDVNNINDITCNGATVQTVKYTSSAKTCTYTKGNTTGTDGAYDVVKN